jgi:hypothetical protein
MTDQLNAFVWPDLDLQSNAAGKIAYCISPARLYQKVWGSLVDCLQTERLTRMMR